ncbi:MAG: PD40 domain-containing protein [Vicinamibacteria bacterium]|nr:PD40 domain-containing protein [Vicinamibacteria bacterium]
MLTIPVDGTAAIPYLQTPFNEHSGRISPDGSWMAYVSDESGTEEIYVQSFPNPGRKRRVSTGGGLSPVWGPTARTLFYLAPSGEVMEAELSPSAGGIEVRPARALFKVPPPVGTGWHDRNQFAVTADGQRFLISLPVEDPSPRDITVILNWKPGAKP